MKFVTIPSGSFQMGAPLNELGTGPDERPVHTVTFNYSFEMMTTEVTQSMWLEIMGCNPSHFSGLDHPVEMVSWEDCHDFIEAMNALDPNHTYWLPSESEWEYSCRAGTSTRYYWGDDLDYTEIDNYAWYDENSGYTTHTAAEKLPNSWGLYDMSGNVWELCQDWYHSDYVGAPADGSAWETPLGVYCVRRGGCWNFSHVICRSARRFIWYPDTCGNEVGFRLARF